MDKTVLQSRYTKAGARLAEQISPIDVPDIVSSLRYSFNSEKTYSYEWRISQLKALRKLLTFDEKELCKALYGDLHKSHFESFAFEISTTIGEIDHILDSLAGWMKPEMKGNTPLTLPSSSFTQRDPLGVVLVFGSWNYPVYLSLNPIVGAIAGGNCVLLKPGSYAKNTSNTLKRLIHNYMDNDCIRCVEGNREITGALLKEKFDKIFFTGSGYVGRIIAVAAAQNLTPCVLELGGKSPCIVDVSAAENLEYCCKRIVWGCFTNCGQTCVRPDFILVNQKLKREFLSQMQKTVEEFYTKDPKSSEWFGRCINDAAFTRLSGLIQTHREKIFVGGQIAPLEKYIAPTLFNFGDDLEAFKEEEIMQDEIFGPLVPIAFYNDLEKVIDLVKTLKTGKPLALYAFGTDSKFQEVIKTRTTSGGLVLNDAFMHLANHNLPFGGVGNSGMGSYHGKYSFECFTHEKAVLKKSPGMEDLPLVRDALGIRFPPYTETKQKLLRNATDPKVGKLIHLLSSNRATMLFKCLVIYSFLRLFGFRLTRK